MKKLLIPFFLFLWTGFNAQAQSQKDPVPEEVLREIEKDVWIPFMESYRELNAEKMISIHSQSIVRVSIGNNRLQVGEEYLQHINSFFDRVKSQGRDIDIQFSILSTAIKENKAYQTGYFCFSSRTDENSNYEPRGFGYFNVLISKENDSWVLSLDSDKPADITYEEFKAGELIYSLH